MAVVGTNAIATSSDRDGSVGIGWRDGSSALTSTTATTDNTFTDTNSNNKGRTGEADPPSPPSSTHVPVESRTNGAHLELKEVHRGKETGQNTSSVPEEIPIAQYSPTSSVKSTDALMKNSKRSEKSEKSQTEKQASKSTESESKSRQLVSECSHPVSEFAPAIRFTFTETNDKDRDYVTNSTFANGTLDSQEGEKRDSSLKAVKPIFLLPFTSNDNQSSQNDDVYGSHVISSSATSSSSLIPLPPVPSDMAEAINRQQKGAGSVKYWKTRHLQTGGAPWVRGRSEGAAYSGSGLFPSLKTSYVQPTVSGNGWGKNVDRISKARGRLKIQRTSSNGNGHGSYFNVRDDALRRCGQNEVNVLSPHTHSMFGNSLSFPQPPPAYKRSVTGVDHPVLSRLLPPDSSFYSTTNANSSSSLLLNNSNNFLHPATAFLSPTRPSPNSSALTTLSDPPKPILKVRLTHTHHLLPSSPHPLGQLPGDSDPDTEEKSDPSSTVDYHSHHHQSKAISDSSNVTVGELTCMQLADTILGTKLSDISRFYQLCQTKIRYVDFLERAAQRHTTAVTSRMDGPQRCNSWVSSLETNNPKNAGNNIPIDEKKDADLNGGKSGKALTLPALVTPSNGLRSSHNGLLSPSNGLLSPDHGVFFEAEPDGESSVLSPFPPPVHIPPYPSGKPILKQDAAVVRLPNHDPFSPIAQKPDPSPSSLIVRGASLYGDLGTKNGGRNPHGSSEADQALAIRKRAVRFSISDQVREYTPGEPVNQ